VVGMTTTLAAPDARAAAVLRRMEIDVTRRLDGLLHGDHRGLVPGRGSEPGESRPYVHGDDVRQIDWNVTARTGATHIRESIADRELETWLIVDRSPSLEFGTADSTKATLALSACAAVGFLTTHGGNRLGAIVAGRDGVTTVPARQGRRHTLGVLSRVASSSDSDGAVTVTFGEALRRAGGIVRRRGLIVVVSDFLDPIESWSKALGALGARHEVLAIECSDPREFELPAAGIVGLVDTETGRIVEINTSRASVRQGFAAAGVARRAAVHAAILGSGADHLGLSTDRDWLADVAGHVTRRKRRRANATTVGAKR